MGWRTSLLGDLSDRQQPSSIKNVIAIQSIIELTMLGLTVQQISAGVSIFVSAIATFRSPISNKDPHLGLAYELCMLSLLSSVSSLVLLRRRFHNNAWSSVPRWGVAILTCVCVIIFRMAWLRNTNDSRLRVELEISIIICLLPIFAITILKKLSKSRRESEIGEEFMLQVYFLLMATFLSIYFLFRVLQSKFGNKGHCSLNTAAENEWGFAQVLAMILLIAPTLSFMDSIGGRSGRMNSPRHC
jgi:hypothetical protein